MLDDGSDFDEAAHEKLLKAVSNLGRKVVQKKTGSLKMAVKKVNAKELVGAISSTRNLNDVKKELQKKKKKRKTSDVNEPSTLSAPVHRLALERIQSSVAYREVQKELNTWAPLVQENRLADQVVFPLEKGKLSMLTGTERLQSFKPRTPLELEMARCLGLSKSNLGNEDVYTEAEKELLKAMSLKEAKLKCAQLQKMRALTSYREAKLKRQAKIKSKSYHRHLKRQKRKQLIKEFDELLIKDPEAAKEKLAEIERQRILERATLKHRNGSKRIQQLARHAARDPEAKKLLEEQIRLGRELMGKHSMGDDGSDSDSSSTSSAKQSLKAEQILEKAAELAAREAASDSSLSFTDRSLTADLKALRQEKAVNSKQSAAKAFNALSRKEDSPQKPTETIAGTSKKDHDEDATEIEHQEEKDSSQNEVGAQATAGDSEQFASKPPRKRKLKSGQSSSGDESSFTKPKELLEETSETGSAEGATEIVQREEETTQSEKSCQSATKTKIASKSAKKRRVKGDGSSSNKVKQRKSSSKAVSIDGLFDDVENRLISAASQETPHLRSPEAKTSSPVSAGVSVTGEGSVVKVRGSTSVSAKGRRPALLGAEEGTNQVDISMDPKHFLHIETSSLTQVPANLMDSIENFDADAEREAIIAEAFEDDDVIASFEEEKATAEEKEKVKDIDLTLQGWGSWTGPGISEPKKDRFVLKAKEKVRRDKGRNGLIVSEVVDSSVEKLQPKAVPFPYTTVEDYEAVVRQPLGKEWNTQNMFRSLTKPAIVTKMGRIIKPLDKETVMKEKLRSASDEDD